ncbi:MAG: PhnD/SsuA/transferrin family substrate-binding protein [Pantoea sp.]|nr:PhnD/SsuA/transferrin family substrate-binding protein [Pantoea sp.]
MKRLSLPMYDIHHPDTRALTGILAQRLRAEVEWPADLLAHWRADDLLLSQTCGYPLVAMLPDVQLVGAFQLSAPGCDGARYRSWLVARQEDEDCALADFRGRRAVANSVDSHSGYNALRYLIAPLAQAGRFFSSTLLSGSHRQSLADLRAGKADIAAIDCLSWALLRRHAPHELSSLAIVGETPLCPAPPLIASAQTDAQTLATLRRVLTQFAEEKAARASFISGFTVPERAAYNEIKRWEEQAAAHGVTCL